MLLSTETKTRERTTSQVIVTLSKTELREQSWRYGREFLVNGPLGGIHRSNPGVYMVFFLLLFPRVAIAHKIYIIGPDNSCQCRVCRLFTWYTAPGLPGLQRLQPKEVLAVARVQRSSAGEHCC